MSGWNAFPVLELPNTSGQDASPVLASKTTGMDVDSLTVTGATQTGSQSTDLAAFIHAHIGICTLYGESHFFS